MPSVPKPKHKPKKDQADRCMRLAAKICRAKKYCAGCGKPSGAGHGIEAAHIIPRRYRGVAADTWNLIPLGHSCHSRFTRNPKEFEWFCDRNFPGRRETLLAVALVKKDVDWNAVWDKLVGEANIAGVEWKTR